MKRLTSVRAKYIRRLSGFALFEALISIALMGLIAFALSSITNQWLPNWHAGYARNQRAQLLDVGLQRITEDLSAAEFITPGAGTKRPLFEGSENSVMLVRNAIGPNARTGLEVIDLAEIRDQRGIVFARASAPFAPMSAIGSTAPHYEFKEGIGLIRAPYRLSFSYAGPDGRWMATWQNMPQLPTEVRINVRYSDFDKGQSVSTLASIRVNAAPECAWQSSPQSCETDSSTRASTVPPNDQ
jgi:general secretion pathway protein J